MRVLVGPDGEVRELYAAPRTPWLRVNMVSTVDGAATGEEGTSKSINNEADKEVFDLLRSLADVLVVGAGTIRTEGYDVPSMPLVVVSRSAEIPETLREAPAGRILMATCSTAPNLAAAQDQLGNDNVLVLGVRRVDLAALKARLAERGYADILSEGGPHLLRDLLDEGVADEVCTTIVPRVVAGSHRRITDGPPVDVPLRLRTLLEQDGTLLARWWVER